MTAVETGERYEADCPQFAFLFNETRRNFRIREASADAAYLSYDNVELVGQAGGTAYILPKSNTTATGGGLLSKMFYLYNLDRDEFLSHHHKRSNVETTFSMIKAKFGDSSRSKTDTAKINEALAKALCHNICRLIQSHDELGIEATFWDKEDIAIKGETAESDPIEAYAWV